jgi:hypothetical protein
MLMPLKGTGSLFDGIHDFSPIYGSIYFVLTATCENAQLESPCSLADLGLQCVKSENIFAYPGSIGARIAATLKPSNFTNVDLDILAQTLARKTNYRRHACLLQTSISIALLALVWFQRLSQSAHS